MTKYPNLVFVSTLAFVVSAKALAVDPAVDSYEYEIPEWMDKERVQLHIPLGKGSYEDCDESDYYNCPFWNINEKLNKDTGIDVLAYTRHVKQAYGGPMWPTQIAGEAQEFSSTFSENLTLRAPDYRAEFLLDINEDACLNETGSSEYDELLVSWPPTSGSLATTSNSFKTNCHDLALRNQLRAEQHEVNMIAYYWLGADVRLLAKSGIASRLTAAEPKPKEDAYKISDDNCKVNLTTSNLEAPVSELILETIEENDTVLLQCVNTQQGLLNRSELGYRMSLEPREPEVNPADETGYRNIVVQRTRELAARGIPAVYFDEFHGAQNGDWRYYAYANEYKDQGKISAEEVPQEKDMSDPKYRELLRRFNENNRSLIKSIMHQTREINPDFTAVMSTTYLGELFNIRSRADFTAHVPVPKNEFQIPIRRHDRIRRNFLNRTSSDENLPTVSDTDISDFAFSLLRDAAYGRPSHIWIYDPARLNDHTKLTSDQLTSAASFIIGLGSIANLHTINDNLDDERYSAAIALKDIGRNMQGHRPYHWIGVYHSEEARDLIYDNIDVTEEQQSYFDNLSPKPSAFISAWEYYAHRAAWDELIYPAVRSYRTFKRRGIPVGIITDHQVENKQFGDYEYIIVPFDKTNCPANHKCQELIDELEISGKKIMYIQNPEPDTQQLSPINESGGGGDPFVEGRLLRWFGDNRFVSEAPIRASISDDHRISYFKDINGKMLVNIYKNIDWLIKDCDYGTDAGDECHTAKGEHDIGLSNQTIYIRKKDEESLAVDYSADSDDLYVTEPSGAGQFWSVKINGILNIAQLRFQELN